MNKNVQYKLEKVFQWKGKLGFVPHTYGNGALDNKIMMTTTITDVNLFLTLFGSSIFYSLFWTETNTGKMNMWFNVLLHTNVQRRLTEQ